MARNIKKYTNPYLKAAIPLAKTVTSAISNIQRAITLHQQGNLSEAAAIYLQLIELDPRNSDALNFLGMIASQTGNHQGAIDLIGRAIEINPHVASYYSNHANALQGSKQFDIAVTSYNKAIELKPNYPEFHYNRGIALQELKLFSEAVSSYDKAISLNPSYAEAYSNRGNTLKELGNLDAAVTSYEKAIALKPDYAEAYYNRGIALQELKKFAAAVSSYNRAITLKPNYVEAYYNRGNAQKDLEQLSDAIGSFDMAILLNPEYSDAYSSRGTAFQKLKQFEAAVSSYNKSIELSPNNAETYSNRGIALQKLKQLDASVSSYDQSIALKPDYAEAYYNRGIALQELKQFVSAISSYDMAIALRPNYAEAYSNRGNTLKELEQLEAAVSSYNKAIELKPDYAEAYYNRGLALQELKQFVSAVSSYDIAFDLNSDIENLLGMRQYARKFMCDWLNLPNSLLVCESKIANHIPAITPFIALTLFDKPELHLRASIIHANLHFPMSQAIGEVAKRTDDCRIRLGYFSGDLYNHPVSIWLAAQLEHHDKSKFELFAFSFKSNIKDPMNARLKSAFDHFIEVDQMSDGEVANLSRKLGIDIALDLGGYTNGSRTGIFANRAAPIQVNHLGFPGSMGAEFIDYVITDFHSIPKSSQNYYSEKIIYLPCGYTYDKQRQVGLESLTREQFGLPTKGFVFTCQNGCHKFMPEVFGIWMEILKAVPGSVLWLLEPHSIAVENLKKEALAHGVSSDRLVFTKRETAAVEHEKARIERYLASYTMADLFLDTWPYNAGTTAVDALWAGLPVLTKVGISAVARMANSALNALEVPELITNTAHEYRDLAVQLATDPQKLQLIKCKVQENRLTSYLFDAAGNTKFIELAYSKIYERYQNNLQPDHIYIID